jgi:hypothetical protein
VQSSGRILIKPEPPTAARPFAGFSIRHPKL